MRSIIIAAAGAAALFAASQAGAAATNNNNAGLETRVVSYKGVDFNNPQSVDRFYNRLANNAREVCTGYTARGAVNDRACVAQIINQAVAGMQRPMLTARAAARSDVRFATGF